MAVDRAVGAAARFLLGRIGPDGKCAGETRPGDPRFGGKTALCVQALLTTGAEPEKSVPLARALVWLEAARLHGTYAVALRANAWALLRQPRLQALLRKDTAWLIEAMDNEGGYTYTSRGGKAGQTRDNSNAQMAVLGVAAGARHGVEVPLAYWNRVEKHWTAQQQLDGGWGYRTSPRTLLARTYGSMTAAGLASLYLCLDRLRADQFVRCEAVPEYEPINKALAWLGKHFRADENPRKGVEWYYYWLYCAARVGLASGHKYFGAHDWYAEGRRALLTAQNPDGSWGFGDRVAETAFSLMFLVRGRHPILINKLRYPGRWNPRPRDAANLARWVSTTYERPVGWQVVNLDSPPADWHEAPLLYLSGAGPVDLSDQQIAKIRTYVYQGGVLLSEAACNSGDFTLDVGRLCKKLFPDWPLIRLPEGHAIYSAHFPPKAGAWLSGVSNGVRLLAVHAPREVSLALQLGPRKAHLPIYELLANIYMHSTDRGKLRPRGSTYWPLARKITPRTTIRLARLKHEGNCDPEPLAWRRLSILLANRHKVKLDLSPLMDIAKLDARRWPIAHMTGTDAFDLSRAETDALKRYFQAGGTLIVDAAGGSRIFSETVAKRIHPLVPGGKAGVLAQDHALYLKGPHELKQVHYRGDYALSLPPNDRTLPRLRVVLQGQRLALIHSREDLTFGLLGAPAFKIAGYSADSAEKLMTNILLHAAGVKSK
ncbi:MAG TPA: DUF4159 domain-containing protein [Phycisphaerae bacterium]|nr:DUF4159 domain-containing protein [Phycisphaerae bacterium]